jgi:hypothetical protein
LCPSPGQPRRRSAAGWRGVEAGSFTTRAAERERCCVGAMARAGDPDRCGIGSLQRRRCDQLRDKVSLDDAPLGELDPVSAARALGDRVVLLKTLESRVLRLSSSLTKNLLGLPERARPHSLSARLQGVTERAQGGPSRGDPSNSITHPAHRPTERENHPGQALTERSVRPAKQKSLGLAIVLKGVPVRGGIGG